MSGTIQLNSSMRANLIALQQTGALMATTEERLATGKRVNSAVDDATAYFSARQNTAKSDALAALKLDINEGLEKVKTSLTAIDSATSVLNQMKSLGNQAKATSDAVKRADMASQFTELAAQLKNIMGKDANYKGTNLLAADNNLTIQFNEDNSSNITINGVDTTTNEYSPDDAGNNWATDGDVTAALSQVTAAIKNLDTISVKFASFSTFIQTRMDFTTNIININKDGADKLTGADINEESANLLALQTRNQLATKSLSISNQSSQNILSLF